MHSLTLNCVVAEFSVWLAFFARIPDWAAVLRENARPLSPSFDFHRLVERDTDGAPQSLRTRLGFQREHVCTANRCHERASVECRRNTETARSRPLGADP